MVILKQRVGLIKYKRHYLPSSFDELSYLQVMAIMEKKTIEEIINIELPIECYIYLQWIYDLPDFAKMEAENHIIIGGEVYKIPDIKKKEFGKKIVLSEIFKKKNNNLLYICKIVALYIVEGMNDDSINEMEFKLKHEPFVNVYRCYLAILKQYEEVLLMESNLPRAHTTVEQGQAGVGRLKELGDFNIIDMIAVRNGYKIEEVEALDYNTIYLLLWRINELDNYEKRLKAIYDNKRNN